MHPIWKPSTTVAAVIEHTGKFLMVEEETREGLRINQPAGHLDPAESLLQAVVRETLEETAYDFHPSAWLGAYLSRYVSPRGEEVTYLRFAFTGAVGEHWAQRALDTGIVRAVWLSANEIRACTAQHRSPLVLRCLEDFERGVRLPLSALYAHPSVYE